MQPFDPAWLRTARTTPRRILAASILFATVVILARHVAPEWGHALPALLITGTTLSL